MEEEEEEEAAEEECTALTPKLQGGIELSHVFCLLPLGSSLSWVTVSPLGWLLISAASRNLKAVLGGTSVPQHLALWV